MTTATQTTQRRTTSAARVKPSRVDPTKPFSPGQDLEPFGTWTSDQILVPPKDLSKEMAETMIEQSGLFTSREKSWSRILESHRDRFTQVREIEMTKASIRLPKGKLFVSVTEKENFDKITDSIPACVQTRLEEFLAGPGKRKGVKVYYLKPLCVEVDDQLHFTSKKDLMAAIDRVQEEVFREYRKMYILRRPKHMMVNLANASLALPRAIAQYNVKRRQKQIDAYQRKLEFERRKTALSAARTHRKFRTHGCTFDEMLELTNPLETADVIEQYGVENELSRAKRDQLIRIAAGSLPWFVALTVGGSYLTSLAMAITFAPPVLVCDPAFVAEFPDSKGVVMKIGHFDDINGVRHIEI
ncbi:MAG: hypothetical protein AAFX06_19740 [Planctomycetota bacterium]